MELGNRVISAAPNFAPISLSPATAFRQGLPAPKTATQVPFLVVMGALMLCGGVLLGRRARHVGAATPEEDDSAR